MKEDKNNKFDDNVILVGAKPFVNYLSALQFSLEKNPIVIVKSRGKFTARVIDLVEVLKQQGKITIDSIKTDSESFNKKFDDGTEKEIRVSCIEITISRKE